MFISQSETRSETEVRQVRQQKSNRYKPSWSHIWVGFL